MYPRKSHNRSSCTIFCISFSNAKIAIPSSVQAETISDRYVLATSIIGTIAGDFNSDGYPDIVTTGSDPGDVTIVLNTDHCNTSMT